MELQNTFISTEIDIRHVSNTLDLYVLHNFDKLNLVKYYSEESKRILHFIGEMFSELETAVSNGERITDRPFDSRFILFLRSIDKHDARKIVVYYHCIKILLEDYHFAILFNAFDMDGPASGDSHDVEYYKQKYYSVKTLLTEFEHTELFELYYKYKEHIFYIQNK